MLTKSQIKELLVKKERALEKHNMEWGYEDSMLQLEHEIKLLQKILRG